MCVLYLLQVLTNWYQWLTLYNNLELKVCFVYCYSGTACSIIFLITRNAMQGFLLVQVF